MNFTGIDLSLRNTGLVTLDEKGNLKSFAIISNKSKDEELLEKNTRDILDYLRFTKTEHVAIEGLSFISVSSSKDIIYGNYWRLRCGIYTYNKDIDIEIVPVTKWRKEVISKERAKQLKEELGEIIIVKNKKDKERKKFKMPKDWQKLECVSKLPYDVKFQFDEYIGTNKFKKESIFDLSDAYFIAKYMVG